jgi:hypothetical protein
VEVKASSTVDELCSALFAHLRGLDTHTRLQLWAPMDNGKSSPYTGSKNYRAPLSDDELSKMLGSRQTWPENLFCLLEFEVLPFPHAHNQKVIEVDVVDRRLRGFRRQQLQQTFIGKRIISCIDKLDEEMKARRTENAITNGKDNTRTSERSEEGALGKEGEGKQKVKGEIGKDSNGVIPPPERGPSDKLSDEEGLQLEPGDAVQMFERVSVAVDHDMEVCDVLDAIAKELRILHAEDTSTKTAGGPPEQQQYQDSLGEQCRVQRREDEENSWFLRDWVGRKPPLRLLDVTPSYVARCISPRAGVNELQSFGQKGRRRLVVDAMDEEETILWQEVADGTVRQGANGRARYSPKSVDDGLECHESMENGGDAAATTNVEAGGEASEPDWISVQVCRPCQHCILHFVLKSKLCLAKCENPFEGCHDGKVWSLM